MRHVTVSGLPAGRGLPVRSARPRRRPAAAELGASTATSERAAFESFDDDALVGLGEALCLQCLDLAVVAEQREELSNFSQTAGDARAFAAKHRYRIEISAIIGATSSRSDMLVNHHVPRTTTFRIILFPAIMLVVFVDVNVAVNLASRVFAAFFMIQATLAAILASRNRNWWAVAGFVGVGLMLTILIFGLPL